MTNSLVISEIPVSLNEEEIKRELGRMCDGVEDVFRWYFDDEYPMSCVQVNFNSHENLQKVLDKGNVILGGICRPVSILQQIRCYRCQKTGHKVNQCDQEPLNQKYLINLFTEQKKRLMEVMQSMEGKLNTVITRK